MYLIVGVNGSLGGALAERLGHAGVECLGTSRTEGAGLLQLDLADEPATWRLPDRVSAVFLCAAETRLQVCENEPERTARLNVERTLELAGRLAERGAFIVYPSSNLVFDGRLPIYSADAPRSPTTEYGRQKARVEAEILRWQDRVAVVRITKVVHPGMPLLHGWVAALRRGEAVRAFSNLRFSPITPVFVAEALCAIADRRLAGITHLSGNGQMSYADLAFAFARRLGVSESLVVPTEVPDGPARSAVLDPERATRELGLPPPDVAQTVGKLIDSLT